MRLLMRLLGEHADRCCRQAKKCETKKAERFMRALAVDLLIEADLFDRDVNAGRWQAVFARLAEMRRTAPADSAAPEAAIGMSPKAEAEKSPLLIAA